MWRRIPVGPIAYANRIGSIEPIPEYRYISSLWLVPQRLSIKEATLLFLGYDPNNTDGDRESADELPNGYVPIRNAFVHALLAPDEIDGRVWLVDHDKSASAQELDEQTVEIDQICDVKSRLSVKSLISWLKRHGYSDYFFVHEQDTSEPYLDPHHDRYAPKLAAAVAAWKAYGDAQVRKGTAKQWMKNWLAEHAEQIEKLAQDGPPSDDFLDKIASMANWDPNGGRTSEKSHQSEEESDRG